MKKIEIEENNIDERIFSVSEYIELLNIGLKKSKAKIIGEVSEKKVASSGHVYFSLKDEKQGAIINCIIWRSAYGMYGIKLEDGMKIIAKGCPEIYAPLGKFSFVAQVIELAGEGELKKEYERLKRQLTTEGLFDKAKKRPIPKYTQKIGLITSKQGAALADFLNNLGKFGFQIKLIDSRVEGQEAVPDLLNSLRAAKNQEIDVLVIIRGGGSFESLMPFSNEKLVREIASFPFPVIAGLGHHKDEPLATFAADMSVSTPTAVANYLSQPWEDAILLLERYERDILSRYEDIFENYRSIENRLKISLENFKTKLSGVRMNLDRYLDRAIAGFNVLFQEINQKLLYSEKVIASNNPARQLKLGYGIAMIKGRVARSVEDFKVGDDFDLRIADGEILAKTNTIRKLRK